MIVNHEYQFIFLKTRKTAGTSIEIALSQLCGPDCIITRIFPEDEAIRQQLKFRGPQNEDLPEHLRQSYKKGRFHNHMLARYVRQFLPEDIWNTYFKFTVERNPFDKAISRYYWSTKKKDSPPPITEYLDTAREHLLSNWEIYTINNEIAVDFVVHYENLNEDLATVMQKIGFPGELHLPHAKGKTRKDKRHYREILNTHAKARIEHICAKEIEAFSYTY